MKNTKVLRVFETFAGIGAQHKGIKYNNKHDKDVNFKVVATSDWDMRANIAYSAIHHNLDINTLKSVLNKHKVNNLDDFLEGKTYSSNSKTPYRNLKRLDPEFKEILVAANLLSNNHSDINQVTGEIIDNLKIDLLTYSFPCQGLSVANMGRDKGIKNSESTSNLVWQIGRILSESQHKPKYLLLENVKQLVHKYNDEYQEWKDYLDGLGYKTFTGIFNAFEHGSLQRRERVFAISVLKDTKVPFEENDIAYKEYVGAFGKKIPLESRGKQYLNIFDVNNENVEETTKVIINDTPSRVRMVNEGLDLSDLDKAAKRKFIINTLTTKQDRLPNSGYIPLKNDIRRKLDYRFITPREAYKIMGFEDKDFDKLKPFIDKGYLNNECLWRQAGNSIDVNVIKSIFKCILEIEKFDTKEENNGRD
ncbi:DNA (cytosine-5-)-methyltransferase [Mycoplasma sp. Pen4]|uniref:DNA (cytosine-5-)-methyltransferase n=1 Tax=Mycoplasma sp. Pen4 TaxID=640330 RepID=UPI001654273C|nr:DNA (cytosine-5-)-methyltransferase [Mycoplasma sp. Pen4]QNM93786.1 DNA (cytosine-5-)-methyltransferase [Mycoplasma sp. Pen4]